MVNIILCLSLFYSSVAIDVAETNNVLVDSTAASSESEVFLRKRFFVEAAQYFTWSFYADSSCSNQLSTDSVLANTCVQTGTAGTYQRFVPSADGKSVAVSYFSDANCNNPTSPGGSILLTTSCLATSSPFPTGAYYLGSLTSSATVSGTNSKYVIVYMS